MSYNLINNTDGHRFEVEVDGYTAFVDYKLHNGVISYTNTEVPSDLSGKGVGTFLAKNVLEYAKENNLRVKPFCPFIRAYIDKNEEYQGISEFHHK